MFWVEQSNVLFTTAVFILFSHMHLEAISKEFTKDNKEMEVHNH